MPGTLVCAPPGRPQADGIASEASCCSPGNRCPNVALSVGGPCAGRRAAHRAAAEGGGAREGRRRGRHGHAPRGIGSAAGPPAARGRHRRSPPSRAGPRLASRSLARPAREMRPGRPAVPRTGGPFRCVVTTLRSRGECVGRGSCEPGDRTYSTVTSRAQGRSRARPTIGTTRPRRTRCGRATRRSPRLQSDSPTGPRSTRDPAVRRRSVPPGATGRRRGEAAPESSA